MIEIQIDSMGVELIIDIATEVDNFATVHAEIISPTGAITQLNAIKESEKAVRVKLLDNVKELGVWGIQVVGEKAQFKSYSEVGCFKACKNLKELF